MSLRLIDLIDAAQALMAAGKHAAAIGMYEDWIAANPADPLVHAAWFNLGCLHTDLGQPAQTVHAMQQALVDAWNGDLKVQALRIAIKCVKLLGDVHTAPQLYPCVFVLVTDVLDCLGSLVFERIKARAREDENGVPRATLDDAFTSRDVNIQAKETCRNWFYKTACIRELLPRMCVCFIWVSC